ncbi:MAG: phosphoribosyl-ATP pyrophosphohydrolase [Microcoleus sp.]
MSKIIYNKLVRDKIPEIIKADDHVPTTRILTLEEYKLALLHKLIEEAKELLDDPGLSERADVQEVLREVDATFNMSPEDIERVRAEKAEKRGSFKERIFLEYVEEKE